MTATDFDFMKWVRAVLEQDRCNLSHAQKNVLVCLGSYADYGTGCNAFGSIRRLTAECTLDESNVRTALKRGQGLGLIELTRAAERGRGRSAVYRLRFPDGRQHAVKDARTGDDSHYRAAAPAAYRAAAPAAYRAAAPGSSGRQHPVVAGGSTHPPLPVPTPVPKPVCGSREPSTSPGAVISHTNRPPSRFCDAHPQGTRDVCGSCANARTAFNAWQAEQAAVDTAMAADDDLERRRRRRLAENCRDCEGTNFRTDPDDDDSVIACDHSTSGAVGHA